MKKPLIAVSAILMSCICFSAAATGFCTEANKSQSAAGLKAKGINSFHLADFREPEGGRLENIVSLARATGIVRYYSPNPYTAKWDSFDWFFIEYSLFKALEDGKPLENTLQAYLNVLAPNGTLTRHPEPGKRKIRTGNIHEYGYWMHHGSGEVQIPAYARILYKHLRDYRPFYKEIIKCTSRQQDTSPADLQTPLPDSIYSLRIGDSLWLNLPIAERTGAFSKKETETLKRNAGKQWKRTMRSYSKKNREQILWITGEKAFRMTDIASRWNTVQHFYPYHEEDSLMWESRLPEMIEAMDTLKTGMLSREDLFALHEAITQAMSPLKDDHLDISLSISPGYGMISYFLAGTNSSPAQDIAGTGTETRSKAIDSILVFNPSLTPECYGEFLPYLDSIADGKYKAVAFDLREYPALDFEKVMAHMTDSALNTRPLFSTPLSCFPDRTHLQWESRDDFIFPSNPRICIPVYFICGPGTMSWGETVLMIAKGYKLGRIIGLPTAGTNGDVSTFMLPAFPFRMTAIKAVNIDGSRHHGIGIQPDIQAEIEDYRQVARIIRNDLPR